MAFAPATSDQAVIRSEGVIVSTPMDGTTTIYKGTFCALAATGYVEPMAQVASLVYWGIAAETKENSGSAGAAEIDIYQKGVFTVAIAGTVTQADLGAEVWLNSNSTGGNDYTVLNINESDPGITTKVGRIVRVNSSSSVDICIDGYAGVQTGSAN